MFIFIRDRYLIGRLIRTGWDRILLTINENSRRVPCPVRISETTLITCIIRTDFNRWIISSIPEKLGNYQRYIRVWINIVWKTRACINNPRRWIGFYFCWHTNINIHSLWIVFRGDKMKSWNYSWRPKTSLNCKDHPPKDGICYHFLKYGNRHKNIYRWIQNRSF